MNLKKESEKRHAFLHSADTDKALNDLGFQNERAAMSQEEYIRVMMLIMVMHPPVLLAMYYGGMFDAII